MDPSTANIVSIIEAVVRRELRHTFTTLLCEVIEYDSEAHTVNIRPMTKMVKQGLDRSNRTYIDPPVIPDVPLATVSAGNSGQYLKLSGGDSVLYFCTMHSLDEILGADPVLPVEPQDPRTHDIMDGFALPVNLDAGLTQATLKAADRVLTGEEVIVGDATATSLAQATGLQTWITAVEAGVVAAGGTVAGAPFTLSTTTNLKGS